MNKKNLFFIIIAAIISSSIFFVGYTNKTNPKNLYRVYLSGKTIGYINSKKKLEDYIDVKEAEIKSKYNVDNVYAPKNLNVVNEITYNKKISSIEEIYNIIKEQAPFTISGYTINIKGVEEINETSKTYTDDVVINVLDKSIFEEAVNQIIKVFVDEKDYNKYKLNSQEKITNTGKIIESIYIQNEMTIKQNKISTSDMIFTNTSDLSKYLLFGTLEEQKKYIVKPGDTIEKISYNNKLSVEEFLIANKEFNDSSNLLYDGQEVTLGILKPAFKTIEEDYVVEFEDSNYKTEIVYDNSMLSGVERVKQQGVNGKNKVSKKVKKINGEVKSAVVIESQEIVPAQNKIIVRGNGTISIGRVGNWAWPTKTPYVITSGYGWRWGKIHKGLDISGTGHGSPIYAANDGVVLESRYDSFNGNFIVINHNNGYYTIYAHMSALLVKKGEIVTIGQQIGKMGATGYAFGAHLHFGVWRGYPDRSASTSVNPLSLYR